MFDFLKKKDETQNTYKPSVDSAQFEQLAQRIAIRDTDISALKSRLASLELDVEHLRGKVLAKLRSLSKSSSDIETEKNISDENIPFG